MAAGYVDYRDRIIQDPEILVGKPVVRGTRISVEQVLDLLAYNPDLQELFKGYPRLTEDDVKACLAYARSRVLKVRKARKPNPAPERVAVTAQ